MTSLPLFPLSLGGFDFLHAPGAVGAVFSPGWIWGQRPPRRRHTVSGFPGTRGLRPAPRQGAGQPHGTSGRGGKRKCSGRTRKAPRRPIAGSSPHRSYSTHVPAAAPAGAGGSPCGAGYRSWLCSFLRCGSSRRKIWSMFRLTVCNSLNRCFCS